MVFCIYVDLMMVVQNIGQNNIIQAKSDKEGMGKIDFRPAIELGTSVWNVRALTTMQVVLSYDSQTKVSLPRQKSVINPLTIAPPLMKRCY